MTQNEYTQRTPSTYDLREQADALLKQAGLTIWGRKKGDENSDQRWFERKMPTGAYSRSGESKRK